MPLKAPASNQVEQARRANSQSLQGMASRLSRLQGSSAGGSATHVAATMLPWLRPLAAAPCHMELQQVLPACWSYFWRGTVTQQRNASAGAGGRGRVVDEGLPGLLSDMALGASQGREGDEGGEVDDPIED